MYVVSVDTQSIQTRIKPDVYNKNFKGFQYYEWTNNIVNRLLSMNLVSGLVLRIAEGMHLRRSDETYQKINRLQFAPRSHRFSVHCSANCTKEVGGGEGSLIV